MAQSLARDAEDFARLMFQTVERLGHDGGWVRAREAFEQTVAAHQGHVYVAHIKAKPARRIGLSAAAERLRTAEFPHIERRKVGTRRNAPVMYRMRRPGTGLELQLPSEVAPSHPLVVKRRARGVTPTEPVSARRAALTKRSPKSPWRRRLLHRPIVASGDVEAVLRSLRLSWQRLCALVSTLAAGVTGR